MNDYEYVIEVSKIRKYRILVVSLCPSKHGCMSAGGTESAEVVVSDKWATLSLLDSCSLNVYLILTSYLSFKLI